MNFTVWDFFNFSLKYYGILSINIVSAELVLRTIKIPLKMQRKMKVMMIEVMQRPPVSSRLP